MSSELQRTYPFVPRRPETVTDRHWRVFLRHIQGESFTAIARDLGITVESVRTMALKAERKVRANFMEVVPARGQSATRLRLVRYGVPVSIIRPLGDRKVKGRFIFIEGPTQRRTIEMVDVKGVLTDAGVLPKPKLALLIHHEIDLLVQSESVK